MRQEQEEGVDTSSSSPSPVMLETKKAPSLKKKGASTQKQEAGGISDNPSAADSQKDEKDDGIDTQRDSGGEDTPKDEGGNSQ